MVKTAKEKQEHQYRAMLINNELETEYSEWFGFNPKHTGVGRSAALGEYLVELCTIPNHDEWFDPAAEAYLSWKKTHGISTDPKPVTR